MGEIMNGRSNRDELGASAVEYGLLIAGIAALVVAAVFLFGGLVNNLFSSSCGTVASEVASTAVCS
jgi:pilus assembly protein Flp/PilA